jgi:hypothetical protein
MTSPVDRISGSEHGIGAWKFVERKDGLFHRHVRRRDFLEESDLLERLAHHDSRRQRRERNADRLGDERDGAARARVDLEHVHDAVLDGVLHVDEAHHASADASAIV